MVDEVCELLCVSLGLMVVDKCEDEGYVILVESVGEFVMFVFCVCEDLIVENGLVLWVVLDNLCKGVVFNVV